MKKLLAVVYPLCALVAFGWLVYKAYPIFPYINDSSVLLPTAAFLFFLFLALRAGKDKPAAQDPS